jgi:hypothetical protein
MKKKQLMISTIIAGLLSLAALPVLAAEGECFSFDRQAAQQFTQETAELTGTLKAKERELREENLYTVSESSRLLSPDYGKINRLESEIKDLKSRINTTAHKYGVATYCSQS